MSAVFLQVNKFTKYLLGESEKLRFMWEIYFRLVSALDEGRYWIVKSIPCIYRARRVYMLTCNIICHYLMQLKTLYKEVFVYSFCSLVGFLEIKLYQNKNIFDIFGQIMSADGQFKLLIIC